MGRPCQIAHNTACHATNKFQEEINGFKKKSSKDSESTNAITLEKTPNDGFNLEEFLVDLYFDFEHSFKRKNLLCEFFKFCNQEYSKIIKFHSVRWLGLSTCLGRVTLKFLSLKAYFCSPNPEKKARLIKQIDCSF